MNIRLDAALSDVVGQSGKAILNAILSGERDAAVLATLVNWRVKKSRAEIERSLTGEWKEEYLFEMQLSYELYQIIQSKMMMCDRRIEQLLSERMQHKEAHPVTLAKKKKNKNAPTMNLEHISTQLTGGVNLYHIEGVSDAMVLTLLSETGLDLTKFPTAKHFTSWLALAPNNRISGGKTLSSKVSHHNNRLAQAFRRAANAIGNMKKGALNQFFRRIAYRYGRMAAITATGRKLAVIVYNMLTKREQYRYEETAVYTERLRSIQLKHMQRKINALNIKPNELSFAIG
jgi:transposase